MRIAILGAGATGTCAALELAGRGLQVDLYDECDAPIKRASFYNEGKVHLGILYAKDTELRTARLMIRGALSFASLLDRWIGFERDRIVLSTPFYYGIHEGTMMDVDGLRAHYASCKKLFAETQAVEGGSYLGLDRAMHFEELPRAKMESLVSPEYFVTMFQTSERAVDPRMVALRLRAAAVAHPLINFVGNARVTRVSKLERGQLAVTFRRDDLDQTERYDHVANSLWHGRLEIDATMRLRPQYPWMYRYKCANRIFVPLTSDKIPSITCALGPFGDIVNFLDNGLFLSWYPTGMIEVSHAVRPPEWEQELTVERRREVFWRSYAEWCKRCPLIESVSFNEADVDPGGGVIFAWGNTDVDDHRSKLHERYEIGVRSTGNYHSVDTGKFTLAPMMGMRTAERILGLK